MKNRGSKIGGGNWISIGLPSIFLLCLFFFLAGYFGSSLLSQQDVSGSLRPQRELDDDKNKQFDVLPHGKTGEASLALIPFQILSWNPRALYFPNFATAEQCQGIIKMAKDRLKPSSLALRQGETAENMQGIRTSSGMFLSSSEDKTGLLDQIETKIAKATMIPRSHGEVVYVKSGTALMFPAAFMSVY